jgi:hypothetical protein
MGQSSIGNSSEGERWTMKPSNRMPLLLALLPWLFILIAGTVGFIRLEQIQNVLQSQQVLNDQQIKTNVKLTIDGTVTLNRALLKQCLEEYSVDDKLAALGLDLLSSQSLDYHSKVALEDFATKVRNDQLKLRCDALENKKP